MRIALLTDGIYPYVIGGMQRHSFYLARYLAAHKIYVDLYHMNNSKLDIGSLEVFTAEEKMFITSHVIEFPSFGKVPGHYMRESYEFSRRIYERYKKQARPDFIYIKGFTGWELLNQKSRGAKFPPMGVNFHGYEMFQEPANFKEYLKFALLLRHPVKFCLSHSDYAFSYGGRITDIITGLGVDRSKIIEIPAGIIPDWLSERKVAVSDVERKFIFVGRFERRKGLPELYRAIASLPKDVKATFTFIGDIPMKHRIANSRCNFEGVATGINQLKKHYSNADILVCPSRSEGMPNVILEAMACGLAVIATDVGAVAGIVGPANGWLIRAGNQSELNSVLLEAAKTSKEVLAQKALASQNLIKSKFLWNRIGEITVKEIEARIGASA